MNFSERDLLEIINNEKIVEYSPAIAYSGFVIILGILGNILAVMFYGFQTKESTTNSMITALAVTDLINSFVLCDEIVELCYTVIFESVAGCRFMYFINHWLVFCSGLLLLLISVDRYRRICHPFAWQFSKSSAKVGIAGMVCLSCATSIRDLVILDIVRVEIKKHSYNETILAYYCTHSKINVAMQKAVKIFHLIDLGFFVVVFPVMAVLYCIVAKAIWKSRKNWCKHDENSTCSSGNVTTTKVESVSNICDKPSEIKLDISDNADSTYTTAQGIPKNVKRHHGQSVYAETKVAIMMIAVTIGSIVSFVPYFIVNLTLKAKPGVSEQEFTAGIQIALRTFMLNSSINPYIMILFNTEFRNFVSRIVCKCCSWHVCCDFICKRCHARR